MPARPQPLWQLVLSTAATIAFARTAVDLIFGLASARGDGSLFHPFADVGEGVAAGVGTALATWLIRKGRL